MKLKYFLRTALMLVLITSNALAQKPDLDGVEIITHHVSSNIYMLEATKDVAGNTGVSIGEDGILIIDTQWRDLHPLMEAALNKLSSGELKYIINTHHHDDHSDGNDKFIKDSDAILITHKLTKKRLAEMDLQIKPEITFEKSMSLFFNNEEIKLISIPGGHTDNDIIVWFTESNVVHLGDLLNSCKTSFPTADYSSGGSAFALIGILEKLLFMLPDDINIIAGHGPLTNKEDLNQTYQMVIETTSLIESKIKKGMTLKKIKSEGLPDMYEAWNHGYTNYESWIEMIYGSYSERSASGKK